MSTRLRALRRAGATGWGAQLLDGGRADGTRTGRDGFRRRSGRNFNVTASAIMRETRRTTTLDVPVSGGREFGGGSPPVPATSSAEAASTSSTAAGTTGARLFADMKSLRRHRPSRPTGTNGHLHRRLPAPPASSWRLGNKDGGAKGHRQEPDFLSAQRNARWKAW